MKGYAAMKSIVLIWLSLNISRMANVVYVLTNVKLGILIVIGRFDYKRRSFVFNNKGVSDCFVIDF